MGKNHVRVLKSMPDVKDIVISDKDETALKQAVEQFGIDRAYPHYADMLDKEIPDGVIIATEPENHRQPALDAIHMGIHVLVEKPIASTMADAIEIQAAAEKGNVVLTVGHTERFNPVISTIKEFINTNALHQLYLVNTRRIGPFPKRFLGKEDAAHVFFRPGSVTKIWRR